MNTSIASHSIKNFLAAIKQKRFQGEIERTETARLVHSVDNSIYELMPQAVIYPKSDHDVGIVTSVLALPEFLDINITAKGGGTGTNGQSLNRGIILDLSRHMNQILNFDKDKRQVTVQTGVVKDQLNDFLKPYGFFFAPELSTSNRATIGGMVSTDASGQGSYTYGKTRHHVISLKGYLANGDRVDTNLPNVMQKKITKIIEPHAALMKSHFPELNRSITGYDTKNFYDDESRNLKHLLCGSEGTLAVLTEATLNLLPIPKQSTLVILSYDDFIDALRHSAYLMTAPVTPTSIEVMDDHVVERARNDYIWEMTKQYLEGVNYTKLKAILLVEFNSDDSDELEERVNYFVEYMEKSQYPSLLSVNIVNGDLSVKAVYGLRKRAVGLLGSIKGERRTMAFVEDCAVPPESLADFIIEFRGVLDLYDLSYGMFGHVDAGVLHVRPALDLKTKDDRKLIKKISDHVYSLAVKYQGVLWGEHGKGIRSDYSQAFFGEFYPVMREIKYVFDSLNQMNPGKIATPLESSMTLYSIDKTPMRGEKDALITQEMWDQYRHINFCNGNGACFNYDLHSPMCPSYKATRDRVQSPKGRAVILKEWERRRSTGKETKDLEEEIHSALKTCLSCGSCTAECPIMVDIPEVRSQFMDHYYQTRKRPLVDYLLAQAEESASLMYKMRRMVNPLFKLPTTQFVMKKIGLMDTALPKNNRLPQLIREGKVTEWNITDIEVLLKHPPTNKKNSIIIVPDALNKFFDGKVLKDCIELLSALGLKVYLAPYLNSGKVYHVLGMRDKFSLSAKKQNELLLKLATLNIPMIGIEPPITLLYRKDYKELFKKNTKVQLIQEFLSKYLSKNPDIIDTLLRVEKDISPKYYLLSHCMEKTGVPNGPFLWQEIFSQFGVDMEIVSTGCCGMSGLFGHLTDQQELSKRIYEQSWKVKIDEIEEQNNIVATGFSCRTQAERFSGCQTSHPVTILNSFIKRAI